MALPLLLAAAASVWGREAMAGSNRERQAEAFRSGLGERSSLDYPTYEGGAEAEGPPQMVPGSGLLGATKNPQQAALLELAGRMANVPGVRPQDLLSLAQGITEMGTREQMQSSSLGAEWARMLSGQAHETGERGIERDFRERMQYSEQDFRESQGQLDRDAREAARQGDYRHAFELKRYESRLAMARDAMKGPEAGQGRMFYPMPSGAGVIGPMSGTEQYATGVKDVRGAGQIGRAHV